MRLEMKNLRSIIAALAAASFLVAARTHAGPPYTTDDPEPVAYRQWELYLATQHELTRDDATGTAPHMEINYGAVPNLQLHLIAPLAYTRPRGGPTAYGPGDIELGAKVRFVPQGQWVRMVGTFPLLELPVGSQARGLGTGHLRAFIPLWLQKSFGPWTTYGGGGYWINPGEANRDFWLVGWLVQRQVSKVISLGAEVFYTTPDRIGGRGNLQFNIGCVLDLSELHHIMFSAGRSIVGESLFLSYLAYQLTL